MRPRCSVAWVGVVASAICLEASAARGAVVRGISAASAARPAGASIPSALPKVAARRLISQVSSASAGRKSLSPTSRELLFRTILPQGFGLIWKAAPRSLVRHGAIWHRLMKDLATFLHLNQLFCQIQKKAHLHPCKAIQCKIFLKNNGARIPAP